MANSDTIYSQIDWNDLSHRERLDLMDEYYENNVLYETTRIVQYQMGLWNEDKRPLRTPVHRSVEFYATKVASGEAVVSSKNQSVTDAVNRVMEWSNFQITKPQQVRNMAKYGDLFRKVVSENGKVWHEAVNSKDVSDFKEDTRGFLTEIRLDTPVVVDGVQMTQTEFWTTLDNVPYMAIWQHRLGSDATLEEIQRVVNPIMYKPLRTFGIDFVPFARTPFQVKETGEWGMNCVEHALLKVDEANRQATRLHQILYRFGKPLWVVSANQVLADGSPVAPPKLKQGTNADKTNTELRDNSILYLPGQATVNSLVPNIDYAAALSILQSQEKELERDLPELIYFSLPERADLSGKALRTLLGAAVDRVVQAQSNFTESTVRLNQMALTIGMFQGIFSNLGNFDDGTLAHSLKYGDPFPMDALELGQALQALTSGGLPLKSAMKRLNFSEEEIDGAIAEKQAQEQRKNQDLANAMLSFNRG